MIMARSCIKVNIDITLFDTINHLIYIDRFKHFHIIIVKILLTILPLCFRSNVKTINEFNT